MEAPHQITAKILTLVQSISEHIGRINSSSLKKIEPELRKRNKIKTIHSTLAIEGNTLTEDEVTKIIDEKWVKGPKNDIIEVQNAIEVYNELENLNPYSEASFRKAHKILTKQLLKKDGGKFRNSGVGVGQHIAPPHNLVPKLMSDLFNDLKKSKQPELIKSCIFHYEHLFIHPFIDGNGRMGRLWQTLLLTKYDPIFQFIPIENFIKSSQQEYYKTLRKCDVSGSSTLFIEFMLKLILDGLNEFSNNKPKSLTNLDRLQIAKSNFKTTSFTRKEYLKLFLDISAPTATRDLKLGVEKSLLKRIGMDRKSEYIFIETD